MIHSTNFSGELFLWLSCFFENFRYLFTTKALYLCMMIHIARMFWIPGNFQYDGKWLEISDTDYWGNKPCRTISNVTCPIFHHWHQTRWQGQEFRHSMIQNAHQYSEINKRMHYYQKKTCNSGATKNVLQKEWTDHECKYQPEVQQLHLTKQSYWLPLLDSLLSRMIILDFHFSHKQPLPTSIKSMSQ